MRKFLLGIPLDDFSLDEIIERLLRGKRQLQIFINIHKVVLFHRNDCLRNIILDDDSLFSVDGKWVEWMALAKGLRVKQRFGGLDVVERICALSEKNKLKIYFLGAKEDVLNEALNKIKLRFPLANIVGSQGGYFYDEENLVRQLQKCQAEVFFLGLPSPKKEILSNRLFKEVVSLRYVCGVGGGFDILAGKHARAPLWMQQAGFEWFYRCLQSPKYFRRYCSDFFVLMYIMIKCYFKRVFGVKR